MILVYLDSGPLGRISNPRSNPVNAQCSDWARLLVAGGIRVVVPEIADYEIRRELIRVGATVGLARLDLVKANFHYASITTDVMLRAAELWADVRRQGRPTASPDVLDGDAILAAQAIIGGGPDDSVIVATDNVGHLERFVDARPWAEIEA